MAALLADFNVQEEEILRVIGEKGMAAQALSDDMQRMSARRGGAPGKEA